MKNGSYKNIEDIEIWDKIVGQDNIINTVLWYDRPKLWTRKLYSINNGPYFVTHEHPFMTLEWWKSINPDATWQEMPNFKIRSLELGDILVKENWEYEYIWTIQSKELDSETLLYNFKLDGNNTYYANGYLVHNKTQIICATCGSLEVPMACPWNLPDPCAGQEGCRYVWPMEHCCCWDGRL